MAARYPLVLVLEDIHWADAGLLDFVDHVADWAQGPILMLTLARPELFDIRPTWGGGKRNAASIYLDPLSESEAAAMVDDLLPGEISDELRQLIVERSEGNPLYIEEIVRTLIDEGVLRATEASRWEVARRVEEVELPRSIQGLIAARLDALPDDEKAVLQDAAVVGRVFWTGAVASITGRDLADVRETLGRLRVKELVVPQEPSSFSGEAEFAFRHDLIRDGAYESLPKSLRAEKHAGVARWAAERAGDRADEIAELVATHYVEALHYLAELGETVGTHAGLELDGYRWARAAGDRASALWQQSEAIRWYREALRLAEPAGIPLPEQAEVARAHALACWGTASIEELEAASRQALELFEAIGDDSGAGWAETRMAWALFPAGRDEEVELYSKRGIERLEASSDSEELSDALHVLGWFYWRRGKLDDAEPLLRRSMQVAERAGAVVDRAQAMQTLSLLLLNRGRLAEGLSMLLESFRLAKETGNFGLLLRAYNNVPASISEYASDYARAEEIVREGIEISSRAGARQNLGWLLGTLGDVLFDMGRLPESEVVQLEALEHATAVRDGPLTGMRSTYLGMIRLLRGDVDEAVALLSSAEDLFHENPEPQTEALLELFGGQLAEARGDDATALDRYERVRKIGSVRADQSVAHASYALTRLLLRTGRAPEARETRIEFAGEVSPAAVAFSSAMRGLADEDPAEASSQLRDAAGRFEALGRKIELARTLLDLGRVQQRTGEDPRPSFERARELLVECDAARYLPEADELLANAPLR